MVAIGWNQRLNHYTTDTGASRRPKDNRDDFRISVTVESHRRLHTGRAGADLPFPEGRGSRVKLSR